MGLYGLKVIHKPRYGLFTDKQNGPHPLKKSSIPAGIGLVLDCGLLLGMPDGGLLTPTPVMADRGDDEKYRQNEDVRQHNQDEDEYYRDLNQLEEERERETVELEDEYNRELNKIEEEYQRDIAEEADPSRAQENSRISAMTSDCNLKRKCVRFRSGTRKRPPKSTDDDRNGQEMALPSKGTSASQSFRSRGPADGEEVEYEKYVNGSDAEFSIADCRDQPGPGRRHWVPRHDVQTAEPQRFGLRLGLRGSECARCDLPYQPGPKGWLGQRGRSHRRPVAFSIACRQTGPITLPAKLPAQQNVFSEKTSAFFKNTKVIRMFDRKHNTLVYLAISKRVIEGSPENAISTVPVMPWGGK